MKTIVKAKKDMTNMYAQVLFIAGREYMIVRETKHLFYILNELHSESPVSKTRFERDFE